MTSSLFTPFLLLQSTKSCQPGMSSCMRRDPFLSHLFVPISCRMIFMPIVSYSANLFPVSAPGSKNLGKIKVHSYLSNVTSVTLQVEPVLFRNIRFSESRYVRSKARSVREYCTPLLIPIRRLIVIKQSDERCTVGVVIASILVKDWCGISMGIRSI